MLVPASTRPRERIRVANSNFLRAGGALGSRNAGNAFRTVTFHVIIDHARVLPVSATHRAHTCVKVDAHTCVSLHRALHASLSFIGISKKNSDDLGQLGAEMFQLELRPNSWNGTDNRLDRFVYIVSLCFTIFIGARNLSPRYALRFE